MKNNKAVLINLSAVIFTICIAVSTVFYVGYGRVFLLKPNIFFYIGMSALIIVPGFLVKERKDYITPCKIIFAGILLRELITLYFFLLAKTV